MYYSSIFLNSISRINRTTTIGFNNGQRREAPRRQGGFFVASSIDPQQQPATVALQRSTTTAAPTARGNSGSSSSATARTGLIPNTTTTTHQHPPAQPPSTPPWTPTEPAQNRGGVEKLTERETRTGEAMATGFAGFSVPRMELGELRGEGAHREGAGRDGGAWRELHREPHRRKMESVPCALFGFVLLCSDLKHNSKS